MRSDAHPFICSNCKLVTPHIELTKYETSDVKDAPEEVWLVECQRCFLQRIIYPSDRVASKEDDIVRCDQCGGWKMKAAKCRICRLAAGKSGKSNGGTYDDHDGKKYRDAFSRGHIYQASLKNKNTNEIIQKGMFITN